MIQQIRATEGVAAGTTWSLVARLLQMAVKLVAVVVLARVMGPGEYGIVAFVLSSTALLTVVADLGMAGGTARLLAEDPSAARCVLRRTALALGCTLGAGIVLLWLTREHVAALANAPILANGTLVVAALLVAQIAQRYLSKVYEGLGAVALYGRILALLGSLPWLLPVIAVWWWSTQVTAVLLAQVLGYVMLVAVAVGVLRQRVFARAWASTERCSEPRVATIARYSLPMVATAASFFVFSQSDVLIIQAYLGSQDVGVYSVAVRMIETAHVPAGALGGAAAVYLARYYRTDPARARSLFTRLTSILLTAYVPAALLAIMVGRPAIELLFGVDYADAATIIAVYTPYLLAKAFSSVYALALDYLGFAARRAVVVGAAAAMNVALNIFLVPRLGIVGAAIATQITYVPVVIYYAASLRELFGVRWSSDDGRLLGKVLTSGVIMLASGYVIGVVLIHTVNVPLQVAHTTVGAGATVAYLAALRALGINVRGLLGWTRA